MSALKPPMTLRHMRGLRASDSVLQQLHKRFAVLHRQRLGREMSSSSCSTSPRVLTMDTLNPNIKVMEYAVRGPLVIRATEIAQELAKGAQKPFKQVLRANIGDCHAMGQKPIQFIRDVMALVIDPRLMDSDLYPEDAKRRARDVLDGCNGCSVGSYTDSPGIQTIRKKVAEYIEARDGGIPCDWQNVVLSAGASDGIKNILKLLICPVEGKKPGVMVPIPQYPLYSASLAEFNMAQVDYYLNEEKGWALDIPELQRSLNEARNTCNPRAIVVINPGNPTGQVLKRKNIEEIIDFAYRERLYILADEVYQHNIYGTDCEFHSFKKVLTEMGAPYDRMELASFMSVSKGYMGECGIRGGYAEVINMDPEVKAMYLKAISAMLCPTTIGQSCLYAVVDHPKPGEPSYDCWKNEKDQVLSSLKSRAKMVVDAFNSFEGFSCNEVQGAMYAFPRFQLPPKAVEAAKKAGQAADVFYAFQLLENTGICIVPGTGFGQVPGTHHFRTTILPQTDKLEEMLAKFDAFHKEFIQKYK